MKNKTFLSLIVGLLFLVSCKEKDKGMDAALAFDRGALLTSMSSNLIMPAYDSAVFYFSQLHSSVNQFKQDTSLENLQLVQQNWKQFARSWQLAAAFNFGPAAESGIKKSLSEEIASFPVSSTKIESFIMAKDTSFANFDRDSRGIFAIEYLVFDLNQNNPNIFQKFASDPWRMHYLLACVHQVGLNLNLVQTGWKSYQAAFVSNVGTDIGSSTSLLYNDFLKYYEGLKNFKFGIPLGRRPGQTTTLPANVEAYYSGYSTELAKEHWRCVQLIWNGTGLKGEQGIGFKAYLEKVEGGNALITLTQNQVAATQAKIDALPAGKLSEAIQNDFAKVDDVHTELQKLTRFFKSDLSSLIGIAVTYSSGDGD
ncbi:MAG: imelysin family protein [Bacteroidia bacterium]|nr:imelysin family protein [Bacteroidia bacterium]